MQALYYPKTYYLINPKTFPRSVANLIKLITGNIQADMSGEKILGDTAR